jgi:hypothetical protein
MDQKYKGHNVLVRLRGGAFKTSTYTIQWNLLKIQRLFKNFNELSLLYYFIILPFISFCHPSVLNFFVDFIY